VTSLTSDADLLAYLPVRHLQTCLRHSRKAAQSEEDTMGRNTIWECETGLHRSIGGRTPGIFASIRKAVRLWRERVAERQELAALSQRDLADLGIPPSLAAYEASRWPWQNVSSEWRELDEAGRAISPDEPASADPPRDCDPSAMLAVSVLPRGRV
jgi:uncharacterized protein YjiS (DUF1127 family)